jgi:glycosyltransferase involved in cell wall biosynthesis
MSGIGSVKPHLLYIAFAYPPSTASSVYRSLAVPNAFIAAGWDVTVLTIDSGTWSEISGADTELLDSVDPAIRVVRVSDGGAEDRAKGNLRVFSRLRVEAPYVSAGLQSLRSRRAFPEAFHGLWLKPASAAARGIHQHHPVDLVLGSASPYVSFAVARSLPGVPYVMDYRDAWAFNTITGHENFSVGSRTGWLESTFLEEAAQVWFVNTPIRDEYARRYPEAASKMRVVPNGFDPQPGHARPVIEPVTEPSFGYLGTLQHENNPFEELLDGWVDAFGVTRNRDQPAATARIRGKLSSSGSVSPQLLRRLEGVRQHGLEFGGPVPKRQVANFYGSLDALILLLASGKYVTGGKTAEYLATGLPIVSVHDQGNAATELLRDYPLWFPARELTAASVSAALRDCAQALRTPDEARWEAAWEYGQSFLRTALMAPVIEELTNLVTGFQHELQSRSADAPGASGSTAEPVPVRQPDPTARQDPGGGAADVRQVKVLVIMDEGSTEVLEDLRARTSSIGGIAVSLVAFVADGERPVGEAHLLPASNIGPTERLAQQLAAVHGPAGVLGRLLRDNLRSRKLARSVLDDRVFMAELLAADVVMAADSGTTRAVWQLRSRTQADLVRGAVALVHVLRNR